MIRRWLLAPFRRMGFGRIIPIVNLTTTARDFSLTAERDFSLTAQDRDFSLTAERSFSLMATRSFNLTYSRD
jgi:hypothetical protein